VPRWRPSATSAARAASCAFCRSISASIRRAISCPNSAVSCACALTDSGRGLELKRGAFSSQSTELVLRLLSCRRIGKRQRQIGPKDCLTLLISLTLKLDQLPLTFATPKLTGPDSITDQTLRLSLIPLTNVEEPLLMLGLCLRVGLSLFISQSLHAEIEVLHGLELTLIDRLDGGPLLCRILQLCPGSLPLLGKDLFSDLENAPLEAITSRVYVAREIGRSRSSASRLAVTSCSVRSVRC
jgi:hypothetical protein